MVVIARFKTASTEVHQLVGNITLAFRKLADIPVAQQRKWYLIELQIAAAGIVHIPHLLLEDRDHVIPIGFIVAQTLRSIASLNWPKCMCDGVGIVTLMRLRATDFGELEVAGYDRLPAPDALLPCNGCRCCGGNTLAIAECQVRRPNSNPSRIEEAARPPAAPEFSVADHRKPRRSCMATASTIILS